jgi:hypothetical protein
MRARPLVLSVIVAVAAMLGFALSARSSVGATPDPADFVRRVDNPWFPLRPGTTYVYRGTKDGKPSRDVVRVTRRTKVVAGIPCVVVRDDLYLRGRPAERTSDWYAQDRRGNVWYLGESTAELDPAGHVTSTEGSWKAGAAGAEPGVFMPAHPRVGQSFRTEFYRGHAEDHVQILSVSSCVDVPYVSSRRALLTKEWTPLEPGTARPQALRSGPRRCP